MKLKSLYKYSIAFAIILVAAVSCKRDPSNPGKEYAPNMYLPVGYEPYRQEKANPINPMGLTMRLPVEELWRVVIIRLRLVMVIRPKLT